MNITEFSSGYSIIENGTKTLPLSMYEACSTPPSCLSLSLPLPHTSKVPYGRGPSDSARARARSPQFLNGNTGKSLIRHGEVRAELQIAICLILP